MVRAGLADTVEAERLRALIDTRGAEIELSRLRQRLLQLDPYIEEQRAGVEEILAAPSHRLPVEADIPDAVVATRRAAENRRACGPHQARLDRATVERDQVALEAVVVARGIAMRWAAAGSRVGRLTERAGRREARYWKVLVRHHPEAKVLLPLLELTRPSLPGWAAAADEQLEGTPLP